jgi:NADH-ubiquinone oxidoreductase chain 5
MFLGWELVGVVSYLLVNYWYTSISNNFSAMKALFMNKIGDWAMIIAIVLAIGIFADLSFPVLFSLGHLINNDLLFIILLMFIVGASTKSAQIG